MKTCPVCSATTFDDMEVCYGCLHRFGSEEPATEVAQVAPAAGEALQPALAVGEATLPELATGEAAQPVPAAGIAAQPAPATGAAQPAAPLVKDPVEPGVQELPLNNCVTVSLPEGVRRQSYRLEVRLVPM